jgi:(4S)-4-hydroxy-5-phosphonooxypentane-2,3-dione isomerase
MGYVLAVTWVATPGEEERVADVLRAMVPLTRAEPGCIQYTAHRSVDDPRRFFLFEEYVDEAALQAHTETDHFQRHVIGEAVPRLERRERLAYRPLDIERTE